MRTFIKENNLEIIGECILSQDSRDGESIRILFEEKVDDDPRIRNVLCEDGHWRIVFKENIEKY